MTPKEAFDGGVEYLRNLLNCKKAYITKVPGFVQLTGITDVHGNASERFFTEQAAREFAREAGLEIID
jgi:hypothetical protein